MIELDLRRAGVTIVMFDKVLPPVAPRSRVEVGDIPTGVTNSDASGRFRRD